MTLRLHTRQLRTIVAPVVAACLALGLVGCAAPRGPRSWLVRPYDPGVQRAAIRGDEPACAQVAAAPGAALRLGLPGRVKAGDAPIAASEAERHVFANLYETLVRVGCHGDVEPGLATSWSAYDGGRTWAFVLRPGAAFWDGTPVHASDVVASWRRVAGVLTAREKPTSCAALDLAEGQITAIDPDTVVVHLFQPVDALPLWFAHPDLVTAGGLDAMGWPLGTGPCRPLTPAVADSLVLGPNPHHPQPAVCPAIGVVELGPDVRDDVDGALVRDRDEIAAWQLATGMQTTPLPWDQVYLLLTPPTDSERSERERERWTTGWDARDLARRVAASSAWPAADPFFVDPVSQLCPGYPPDVPSLRWPAFDWPQARASRLRDLILYPEGWPDAARLAGDLAEVAAEPRLPGLDVVGRGPLTPDFLPAGAAAPQAVGVPATDFLGALQSGRAGAYVLPLWRQDATACAQMLALLARASWLQSDRLSAIDQTQIIPPGATAPTPYATSDAPFAERIALRLDRDEIVRPLVLTRATLLTRAGLDGLAWDAAGVLDLSAARISE